MEHHFNTEFAAKYGLIEAILFNHFEFWIEQNRANERNYHDGTYWTYNSIKSYAEIFPYLTQGKIKNALKHLETEGILQTGVYNENAYDRTLWYAFTKKGESICKNQLMDLQKSTNGFAKTDEPIPYNNTYNNSFNNTNNINIYAQIIDLFHKNCFSFPKITALSDKRKKMINARLNTYGIEKITEVFKKAESSDFLKGKNNRDWKANFDWIMNDSNFAKILDGNYDNKTSQPVTENKLYQDNFDHNFLEALTRKRNF